MKDNFFTNEDRIKFAIWLINKDLSLTKAAEKCGFSKTYLSLLVNGKRPFTEGVKSKLEDLGYDF